MLLAVETLTITGLLVGFALWLGLIFAVGRWGPWEDGFPLPGRNRDRDTKSNGR